MFNEVHHGSCACPRNDRHVSPGTSVTRLGDLCRRTEDIILKQALSMKAWPTVGYGSQNHLGRHWLGDTWPPFDLQAFERCDYHQNAENNRVVTALTNSSHWEWRPCGKGDQDCMEQIAGSSDPKIRRISEKDWLAVEICDTKIIHYDTWIGNTQGWSRLETR